MRRALVIGVNVYPQQPLRGCVADAQAMREILSARGYSITMLLDADATAAAIERNWRGLLQGARSGDRLVITYSGHGTSVRDVHGDEPDGLDEAICPVNFTWADRETWLLDDDFARWIREAKLPTDVHLTVVFDSCHAGTALRALPFVAGTSRVFRAWPMPPAMTGPPAAWWRELPWPLGGLTCRTIGARMTAPGTTPAQVVLLAMTQPQQLAADAYIDGGYHGAGTYALQVALTLNASPTLKELRKQMVRWLVVNGYGGREGQKPTCYGSHALQRLPVFG